MVTVAFHFVPDKTDERSRSPICDLVADTDVAVKVAVGRGVDVSVGKGVAVNVGEGVNVNVAVGAVVAVDVGAGVEVG